MEPSEPKTRYLASVVKETWIDKEAESYETDIRISKLRLQAPNDAIRKNIVALPTDNLFSTPPKINQNCEVHGSGMFWLYKEVGTKYIKDEIESNDKKN